MEEISRELNIQAVALFVCLFVCFLVRIRGNFEIQKSLNILATYKVEDKGDVARAAAE